MSRELHKNEGKIEGPRFLVMGNVDSGKTSLIGVLCKNVLDDGKGYARSLIVTLHHEVETGRTSNHAHHYIVNDNKVTTLIDLCGHEKYLKTTMFGVTGLFGDYGIIVVGANMGISTMTREHIMLLIANRIPFIVVITKVDICPPHILQIVEKDLNRLARKNKREPIWFQYDANNSSDLDKRFLSIRDSFASGITNQMPIILSSNKTGDNIPFIRQFLTNLHPRSTIDPFIAFGGVFSTTNDAIFFIDNFYTVPGIGIVLSGTNRFGTITLGQRLYIGPLNGKYLPLTARSIRNCVDENVNILRPNESGSINIRTDVKNSYAKKMFRKGQIMASNLDFVNKHTCYSFNCDVAIFNHQTTIRNGYQSVIHCQTVRQVARFIINDTVVLRSNSKQNVDVKFLTRPEFILPGHLFMFRDGKTKGMGRICKIIPTNEDSKENPPKIKKRGQHNSHWKRNRRTINIQ